MRFFRRRSNPGFLALLAVAMQLGLALAQTHFQSGMLRRSNGLCGRMEPRRRFLPGEGTPFL